MGWRSWIGICAGAAAKGERVARLGEGKGLGGVFVLSSAFGMGGGAGCAVVGSVTTGAGAREPSGACAS